MATELKNHNIKAITLHPGGAQTEVASFPDGESPKYVGRSILAICENADDNFFKLHKKIALKKNLNVRSFGIKNKRADIKLIEFRSSTTKLYRFK